MSPGATPSVTEIVVADEDAGPYGITSGPDGALWAALETGGVARVAP
ncbi:hypothetical protein ACF1DW_06140 [Streptomyces sp. NPDC014603]|nr:hypothetical protein [Streptomyces sp. SID9913]